MTGELAPLHYTGLREWEPTLREMPGSVREYLPGITPERGYQLMLGQAGYAGGREDALLEASVLARFLGGGGKGMKGRHPQKKEGGQAHA